MSKFVNCEKYLEYFQNNDYIRIWTFQNDKCVERLKNEKVLYGDDPRCFENYDDELFTKPYEYMREQMSLRLNNFSGKFPVWAHPKRPNLRKYSPQLRDSIYDSHNLVIADVPTERVLISDFDMWNLVIQDEIITLTEEEDMLYYEHNETSDNWGQIKTETIPDTWHRVFEIKTRTGKEGNWLGYGKRQLQLCIDGLNYHEVVKIKNLE